MKYEVRLRDYNNLDLYLSSSCNVIGIGDEGCIHLLPAADELLIIAKKIHDAGKTMRLVTPKVAESKIEALLDIIEALNEKKVDYLLTINDYGVLYACKQRDILPDHVCIGRGISRSFEDCLWHEHILRAEDDFNRLTIAQNNMAHKTKIRYLSDFNVDAIESNMLKLQNAAYEKIVEGGWKVNVNYGNITLAFSRACQTAQYYKKPAEMCGKCCKSPMDIRMTKLWDKRDYQEICDGVKKINPEYLLLGNVLYRENQMAIDYEYIKYCDCVILNDWQFDSKEAMDKAIDSIEEVCRNGKTNN